MYTWRLIVCIRNDDKLDPFGFDLYGAQRSHLPFDDDGRVTRGLGSLESSIVWCADFAFPFRRCLLEIYLNANHQTMVNKYKCIHVFGAREMANGTAYLFFFDFVWLTFISYMCEVVWSPVRSPPVIISILMRYTCAQWWWGKRIIYIYTPAWSSSGGVQMDLNGNCQLGWWQMGRWWFSGCR